MGQKEYFQKMVKLMETKIDYSRPIHVYTNALVEAKRQGLDRSKAKAFAKQKLYVAYPEFQEFGDHNDFWSLTSPIVDLHFNRPVKRAKKQPELHLTKTIDQQDVNGRSVIFMDLMRFIASKTGTLPSLAIGKAIGEFFGFADNIMNVTIQNLRRREGNTIEKTTIEAFTCRKPDPRQQEIQRVEQLIKDLSQRLGELKK